MRKIPAIDNGHIDYKSEILRKAIHLCSLSIPIVYYFISKQLALSILVPLAFLSLIIDLARYFNSAFSEFFYKVFGFMLRKHEKDNTKKNLNGATYVLISAVLVILLFPKPLAITAFAVLIIGDLSAALVGRRFGRTKFLSKSLEGTAAFFFFSSIVILFTPKINGSPLEYLIGFIAVAIGAIVENISFGWADDNLTIPISVAISMWILYTILFPNLPLVLLNVPN
ncbi:diacylglycerol/polyprenol kinase family protein [Melioribacteraceae bacterium 4301-Me]|uniref:diacylglycerol/polyprenol kinase family protein n=1 Tax=Pyranulibacter aquaticus TaxID=3163344 RepID=UPI003597E09B